MAGHTTQTLTSHPITDHNYLKHFPRFLTLTIGPPDISFCSRVEDVSLHLIMEQNKLRPRIHVPESPGAADTPSDFAHSISFVILPSVPTKRFLQA